MLLRIQMMNTVFKRTFNFFKFDFKAYGFNLMCKLKVTVYQLFQAKLLSSDAVIEYYRIFAAKGR